MILADTSVWVDHLRKTDATMQWLLQQSRIVTHPFVIGEIALGHLKNRTIILQSLYEIPAVTVADEREVLLFIESRSLIGLGIGFIDVHLLASLTLSSGARLWTRDKRLGAAAATLGLEAKEELG